MDVPRPEVHVEAKGRRISVYVYVYVNVYYYIPISSPVPSNQCSSTASVSFSFYCGPINLQIAYTLQNSLVHVIFDRDYKVQCFYTLLCNRFIFLTISLIN